MVIDTSALVAILLGAPGTEGLARAIADDPRRLLSAVAALEAFIVITAKKGEAGSRELDLLLHRSRIETVAMDSAQTDVARKAWLLYGKGRHPAGLDIGDCCTYALAKHSGEPLLFVGDGFGKTDLRLVAPGTTA